MAKNQQTRALVMACSFVTAAVAPFVTGAAHAQSILAGMHPAALAVVVDAACNTETGFVSRPSNVTPTGPQASKSAAILGGELSALDRIRMQQSANTASLAATAEANVSVDLIPAAGGSRRLGFEPCGLTGTDKIAGTLRSPLDTFSQDDFLASKKVRIGKTSFDNNWRRVRRESMRGTLRREFGRRVGPTLETVDKVNRWVNRTITYVEDRDLFKEADYWAGARKTLRLGKGDCEDYALTKMQLLAAAGVARSDMFLTIARDRVRNADHALLVVKLDDRYLVLDNATDELLDGALSHDYAPVLSFSDRESWLHGY